MIQATATRSGPTARRETPPTPRRDRPQAAWTRPAAGSAARGGGIAAAPAPPSRRATRSCCLRRSARPRAATATTVTTARAAAAHHHPHHSRRSSSSSYLFWPCSLLAQTYRSPCTNSVRACITASKPYHGLILQFLFFYFCLELPKTQIQTLKYLNIRSIVGSK